MWDTPTPYDVDSVMHFPWCNGDGANDWILTGHDTEGVIRVYLMSAALQASSII